MVLVLLLLPLLLATAQGITTIYDDPLSNISFVLFTPTTSIITCNGTTTFPRIPSDTVTVTVTEGYDVGTKANASMPDIYITPPPPCYAVIDPAVSTSILPPQIFTDYTSNVSCGLITTDSPVAMSTAWSSLVRSNSTARGRYTNSSSTILTTTPMPMATITVCATTFLTRTSTTGANGEPGSWGSWGTLSINPKESWSVTAGLPSASSGFRGPEIGSSFAITLPMPSNNPVSFSIPEIDANSFVATITVTKKTPAPPDLLQSGSITFPDEVAGGGGQDQTLGSVGTSDASAPASQTGISFPGPNFGPGFNGPSAGPTNGPTTNNNNGNSGGNPNDNNGGSSSSGSTGRGGIGSIINSAFNSPFTSVGVSTSLGSASRTVTLVGGVPVQVDTDSVYIGGTNVALPSNGATRTVFVAGQTITVAPNAIFGGSDTLSLNRAASTSFERVLYQTLSASTVTAFGIIITVGPSTAAVSGKTFTIGINAQPTSTIIDGQTITFNSDGVIIPTTTFRPAIVTAPAYVVTTVGQIVFSIDQSEAIVSGTTYRIGAGALNSKTTAVIQGTTIVFGPSGVALPTTTIQPTAPSSLSSADSSPTAGQAVNTNQGPSSGAAALSVSHPAGGWVELISILGLLFASLSLPLGVIL